MVPERHCSHVEKVFLTIFSLDFHPVPKLAVGIDTLPNWKASPHYLPGK